MLLLLKFSDLFLNEDWIGNNNHQTVPAIFYFAILGCVSVSHMKVYNLPHHSSIKWERHLCLSLLKPSGYFMYDQV
jgi:hypothetical protein